MTKPWYQSKIVWAGIVTTLISILPLVSELFNQTAISPVSIITLITGALTVIFRIWFTDPATTLTKPLGIGADKSASDPWLNYHSGVSGKAK